MNDQFSLFPTEQLPVEINGVRAVNSIDLHDLKIPFDSQENSYTYLKDHVNKGEYILHSSGSYHYFYNTGVTKLRPGLLPSYFNEPIFPWLQSVHNKSGKIRVPGVPQAKVPYPYIALGKSSKKIYFHILCAGAFIEQPKDPKYCLISHKNDMKWDYSLRNLFWNTHKNNSVGFRKERKLNPVDVFDKWWKEYQQGSDYEIDNKPFEEDQW